MNNKLVQELRRRNDKDFRSENIHQAIMNIMYDEWQARSNRTSYRDMISWFQIEYGDLAAFAVLIGKYNQQVCNGGHAQYFNNGYASSDHDNNRAYDDDNLHHEMIAIFEKLELDKTELGRGIYEILCDFSIDKIEDDDSCSYRHSSHEVIDADWLDDRYYKLYEKWIPLLNEQFKSILIPEKI